MSLIRETILAVAREGEITHKFTLKGMKFVLRSLTTEEQILSDGMVDSQKLKKKYGAEDLLTLSDTIAKYRTIGKIALSIKTVNGQSPVDTNESLEVQFKQRLELRDELMELGSGAVDEMIREFNKLAIKESEFFENIEDNVEK